MGPSVYEHKGREGVPLVPSLGEHKITWTLRTTTYPVTEKTRVLAYRREQEMSSIGSAHSDNHSPLHTHQTILRLFRLAPTLPNQTQHTASRLHSKLSTTDTMQVYPRVQTPPLPLYGVQRADTPTRNAKRSHMYYTEHIGVHGGVPFFCTLHYKKKKRLLNGTQHVLSVPLVASLTHTNTQMFFIPT